MSHTKAAAYLQSVALEQMDSLAIEGTARVLAGFSKLGAEAEESASRVFESYVRTSGDDDPGEFAGEALDQAGEYHKYFRSFGRAF